MIIRTFNSLKKLVFITLVFSFSAHSSDVVANDFIKRLKSHYLKESEVSAFSLTHRYLGRVDAYQSWDYLAPSRYKAFKVTDIDLAKRQYAQNVMHWFTGGLFIDEVHFQNEQESLRYERNGVYFGKGAVKQSLNSFERYKNLTLMNIDFLAIRPLLAEQNIDEKIAIKVDAAQDQVHVVHKTTENNVMEYTFNDSTLRLSLINNKKRKRIYKYDDYITQNGLTFARSVIKHYNGEVLPSFITVNEKFDVIKSIDKEKLALPRGYKKVESYKGKELVLEKINSSLYVVSNEATKRNTLLKIEGNGIWVFGVPSTVRVANQLLAFLNERFPKKEISSVFVTHPYSDHIGGLPAFAKQGVTIYADAYTAQAIMDYPRFSDVINTFRIKHLKHRQVIDDITFYVLENSRSKRQSFAFIKSAGIAYQSDFLEVAPDDTIPNILPSYSKTFINFIRHENLTLKRIVGNHRNSNISPAMLAEAFNAQAM